MRRSSFVLFGLASTLAFACGNDDTKGPGGTGAPTGPGATAPAAASCAGAGGGATVAAPVLKSTFADDGDEGWLGSPAIADLDGDGKPEVVAVRGGSVYAWKADGSRLFFFDTDEDRIWASPIVGNFTGDSKLEIAVAARDKAFLLDAAGKVVEGYPKSWGTGETRTVAAGDLDGDGALDLVVGVRNRDGANDDIVNAYHANGTAVPGFPPVQSGAAKCIASFSGDTPPNPCFFAGLYDQNLAIGDLDGDGKHDLAVPQDNAYAVFFKGTGEVFDSNPMFTTRKKVGGIRYLHDLEQAKQGFPDDDAIDQAHFTNTPPAIADIDKDGKSEIVMVGSVQSAGQDDRLRGVALWVMLPDGSRRPGWEAPFKVGAYVMGLNDAFAREFDGAEDPKADNLVGLTNQVTVADIDAAKPGLEMIFAGYDGKIHAVAADKTELWATAYAENGRALTGGVIVADLSGDGAPEIVFTTYSPDDTGGALFVLSSSGQQLHKVTLPKRGSMAVPTVGDIDGDGTLEILVSLKDEAGGVQVYQVPGSKPNCVLWPTGRGNLLRNGWVR